jgi:hypothetical protein
MSLSLFGRDRLPWLGNSPSLFEQTPKDPVYTQPIYPSRLARRGVLMTQSPLAITAANRELYKRIKNSPLPSGMAQLLEFLTHSIHTYRSLQDKPETQIPKSHMIQLVASHLVPSVEKLAKFINSDFFALIESIDEVWDECLPLTNPPPRPDYAVGFRPSAFGQERMQKLLRLETWPDGSFMATSYMFFPFLTCEATRETTGLEIANRQNAHNMGIAIRSIVSVFKLAAKHTELLPHCYYVNTDLFRPANRSPCLSPGVRIDCWAEMGENEVW